MAEALDLVDAMGTAAALEEAVGKEVGVVTGEVEKAMEASQERGVMVEVGAVAELGTVAFLAEVGSVAVAVDSAAAPRAARQ